MKKTSTLLPLLASISPALSQQFGLPTLDFLYTVNATLGERWPIGDMGFGTRVVIPITGGTFKGPKLEGTVQNLGADWGVTDTKGVFFPDTRYNLRTHDGADIYIQTSGPTQEDGRTLLRGKFETGDERYYWLNYVMAVGVLSRPTGADVGKYVTIDMWQVLLPQAQPPKCSRGVEAAHEH
ncbi:hypothetical protein NLU13_3946 [Sarocladium strictum]|uniref:Uncharacterized protein n=1 Tax=Sarocladium strictum TaxID=5046 RepID=A0AA39GIL5_SARSR|nr:hypothetical protein NLU13_3946 [Sarocladium strictum]